MGDQNAALAGIRQIVKMKWMLKKWQSRTRAISKKEKQSTAVSEEEEDQPKASASLPSIDKRLKTATIQSDSDEEGYDSSGVPPDVPKGCCAVYVGQENRRFVIPMRYLGLPAFKVLLAKAEEEFGFNAHCALRFPCEVETFKYILQCMERYKKDILDYYEEASSTDLEEED
ncbi:uncharacterized protein LOC141815162 [Curcuma longa]|uniref:uncharacterized protein LOC141815162 n=1 Tax=Curcuma longa TaxID=136217 RepID=UPI003D9E4079